MGYDFSKAQGVQLSERGQYLTDGNYELKVERNIIKRTRKQDDLWILEAEVLKSDNPKHPVGCKRNWVQKISDPQVGFRAVKGFLFAAMGFDHKDPDDKEVIDSKLEPTISQILTEAIEDPKDPNCKNALKDAVVKCEVTTIKTKANTDFGLHIFAPKKD